MQEHARGSLARSLDEKMLPFRLARKLKRNPQRGWLRAIREAVGIPVETLAERAGVCRWEIARLEKSEENQRIMLSSLRRAAEGLGCDLVYALVPKQGTVTEMAAAQAELRARALAAKRKELEAKKEVFLDYIGWRPMVMKALRAILRREGYRVRIAMTNRGVEKEIDNFLQHVRVLKVAGMLGGFMKEFMEEQEELKRKRERVGEADCEEESESCTRWKPT
jgi:predicted DNA-binding mobile mystery protein A